jgi:hypothetical protein
MNISSSTKQQPNNNQTTTKQQPNNTFNLLSESLFSSSVWYLCLLMPDINKQPNNQTTKQPNNSNKLTIGDHLRDGVEGWIAECVLCVCSCG